MTSRPKSVNNLGELRRREEGRGGEGGGRIIAGDVVDLRVGAADKGEGGGEDDDGPAGHRAVAQGGAEGDPQLRPAVPRGVLRPHHLPPRHQVISRPGRRPHRLRHRSVSKP